MYKCEIQGHYILIERDKKFLNRITSFKSKFDPFINYIYSNICHGTSLKKPSGNVGTRTSVAGISSQQTCFIL